MSTVPHRGGCEEKLAELILQMKGGDRRPALRSQHGISGRGEPQEEGHRRLPAGESGVTNKAKIARDLNMDRTTVQRYYDEIRAELRARKVRHCEPET